MEELVMKSSPSLLNIYQNIKKIAKNKNYVSPQVLRWTSVALIGLAVYFLIKNKRL